MGCRSTGNSGIPRIGSVAGTPTKVLSWASSEVAHETPIVIWGYAPEGAKRRYEAHFVSKLTDCDGEINETDSSLDFANDCGYITANQHAEMVSLCQEIGKMLGAMIKDPTPFLIP